MAGAPEGNRNSKLDNRLWANTIRRAVLQSDAERLRRIAEAMLSKAEEGDKKVLLTAQLDDVIEQINIQQPIVQAARTALKQAASLI